MCEDPVRDREPKTSGIAFLTRRARTAFLPNEMAKTGPGRWGGSREGDVIFRRGPLQKGDSAPSKQ